MKESDLYLPLKRFLESQDYEVKGEVLDCDVVAVASPSATMAEIEEAAAAARQGSGGQNLNEPSGDQDMGQSALAIWMEKLEFLRGELALASGAPKFALQKQIEEAERKIVEFGGVVPSSQPAPSEASPSIAPGQSDPPPPSTEVFDVFLCHNSQDKDAVKEIARALQRQGLRPWLDVWELRPGLPWEKALEAQITTIGSAAVFVGPSGRGPWQDMELYAFLQQFVKRGCPVIPVILRGVDKAPELPPFLSLMTWVDFRRNDPDPFGQLFWGITGKKPSSAGR